MSTASPSTAASPSQARAVMALDPADAELRCELARWAIGNGRSLSIDVATAILSACRARRGAGAPPCHRWTVTDVATVVTKAVPQLWRLHGLGAAPAIGESMATYLTFLDATGRMSAHSHPLGELAVVATDSDIRRRGHHATAHPRIAPVVPLSRRAQATPK